MKLTRNQKYALAGAAGMAGLGGLGYGAYMYARKGPVARPRRSPPEDEGVEMKEIHHIEPLPYEESDFYERYPDVQRRRLRRAVRAKAARASYRVSRSKKTNTKAKASKHSKSRQTAAASRKRRRVAR